MIKIKKGIVDLILKEGRDYAPFESCGYFAGKEGVVAKRYALRNIDESSDHYSMDPAEQFAVIKQVRAEGLDIIAVYHTHPETPPWPSEEDIRLAYDPSIIYVIASLMNDECKIKSFSIKEGVVEKIKQEIV
ncbi:MAG: M67 family metallopeptidase [Candidatus Theseobacter exili]|nr:M67 family metallopeptidase [Candidatus Theseobacter exili]